MPFGGHGGGSRKVGGREEREPSEGERGCEKCGKSLVVTFGPLVPHARPLIGSADFHIDDDDDVDPPPTPEARSGVIEGTAASLLVLVAGF